MKELFLLRRCPRCSGDVKADDTGLDCVQCGWAGPTYRGKKKRNDQVTSDIIVEGAGRVQEGVLEGSFV